MLLSLGAAPPAKAQTFTVIYNFHGTDGLDPLGNLILDDSGNLYGTTYQGGSAYGYNPLRGMNWGEGTVFRIDAAGNETVLHSFTNGGWDYVHGLVISATDGMYPSAGVVRDAAGNLYGTTTEGGGNSACTGPRWEVIGCGTLFKIDPAGNETVLHRFDLYNDGAYPSALVMDASGNLYGTTSTGGGASVWPSTCYLSIDGCGTVFKIDASGNESVLHTFTGFENPHAGVILDAAGSLYGTTAYGGAAHLGTVFKIDAAGNETVLHSFSGADGARPGGLVRDASGNLYGTADLGEGTACDGYGCGVVFKIDTAGNFSVLHNFNGSDGEYPSGPLVLDASGNLYGSAVLPGYVNDGILFRIDAAGNFSVLYTFTSLEGYPSGGLLLDASGDLYGTTDAGIVFKLAPSAPFASFSAKLDIAAGGLQLQAFFTQGSGAAAIDPVAQGMTLSVGTYTVTIPPGAFLQTRKGWFVYEGTIDGIALDIRLSQTSANSYELQVEGSGANFTSMTKPVTVALAFGNNNGTTVN